MQVYVKLEPAISTEPMSREPDPGNQNVGKTARPRTKRADARRQDVIDRAAELFDESGYFQTSLDDIAAAVGLRKASLYHYFSGKDEILNAIHEEFLSITSAREAARAQYRLPAAQHLLEIVADTLEVIAERPGHIRVFIEHFRELNPEAQAEIAAKRAAYTEMVEDVIKDGVKQGVFEDLDPRLTLLAVFGVCNWAYQWLDTDGGEEPRQTAYALWDLLMRGIGIEEPD
jgi:AcrR family transcriptional regulator